MASPWDASRAIPTKGVAGSSWGNKPVMGHIRFLFAIRNSSVLCQVGATSAVLARTISNDLAEPGFRSRRRDVNKNVGPSPYVLKASAGVFLAAGKRALSARQIPARSTQSLVGARHS